MMVLLKWARDVIGWKWTPLIALAVLMAVLVQRLEAGRRAADELARVSEAAELEARGVATAAIMAEAALRAEAQRLASENADLAAEIARVKREARDARPVIVVRGSTGPVPAVGGARPSAPPGDTAAPPTAPVCLMALGDKGEIRSDAVILRTNAGNLIFVGAAAAWRLEPGPPERLFGGQIVGKVSAEVPERPAGWGFGAAAMAGRDGWMVGPAAALPPARLWRYRLEPTVGVMAGPDGGWGASAALVLRRGR